MVFFLMFWLIFLLVFFGVLNFGKFMVSV